LTTAIYSDKIEQQKKIRKTSHRCNSINKVALASVLVVFATVLGTFNGNAVTVNDISSGTVTYSTDGGSTWTASPSAFNVTGSLYAQFELTSTSYTGSATVTWRLQQDISGTWTPVSSSAPTTTISLTADLRRFIFMQQAVVVQRATTIGAPTSLLEDLTELPQQLLRHHNIDVESTNFFNQ